VSMIEVRNPDGNLTKVSKSEIAFHFNVHLLSGQRAVLRFSSEAAAEQACLIYDAGGLAGGTFPVIHEVGTPPYRNFNDRQITKSGSYYAVGWHKASGGWGSSKVKDFGPPAGYTHKFGFDDYVGKDKDFNDIVVLVFVQSLGG
jgi:hypothetical protein